MYNSLFEYFIENDLISPNQPGSKPGDSCTNQLIFITQEINQSFDDGFEISCVFLDISKALDKVWHNAFIYKLKQNEVAGGLLDTLTNLLKEKKQRVISNKLSVLRNKPLSVQNLNEDLNRINHCAF